MGNLNKYLEIIQRKKYSGTVKEGMIRKKNMIQLKIACCSVMLGYLLIRFYATNDEPTGNSFMYDFVYYRWEERVPP